MRNLSNKRECKECKGTGTIEKNRCIECNGDGKKHEKRMFFWEYDQFPGFLCGVGFAVPKFLGREGYAYIRSYDGHFRYFASLPLKEGKRVKQEVDKVVAQREQLIEGIYKLTKIYLLEVCPDEIKKHL